MKIQQLMVGACVLVVSACATQPTSYAMYAPPQPEDLQALRAIMEVCSREQTRAGATNMGDIAVAAFIAPSVAVNNAQRRGAGAYSACMMKNGYRPVTLSPEQFKEYQGLPAGGARASFLNRLADAQAAPTPETQAAASPESAPASAPQEPARAAEPLPAAPAPSAS